MTGYPSLFLYKDGRRKREKYKGERTLESLDSYVKEHLPPFERKDELWNCCLEFVNTLSEKFMRWYFTYLTINYDQNAFWKKYYFGQIQQIGFGHSIICDSILVIHNGKLSEIFEHQRIIECGDFFNDFAVILQPKCPIVALLMIYVCFLR